MSGPVTECPTWLLREAAQQPTWPDPSAVYRVTETLRRAAPLVPLGEVRDLEAELAAAVTGDAFSLTGGDCAEMFAEIDAERTEAQLRTILQMATVLAHGASTPVVRIGRMAGQFAKPRSAPTEVRAGVTLPSYRGDIVNGAQFTARARTPDPRRMLVAHRLSATTHQVMRARLAGGLGDLRQVQRWTAGFLANPAHARYEAMAGDIGRALAFMRACGVDFDQMAPAKVYASHEALLLDYETALTRPTPQGGVYASSGHLVWVGDRTRDVHGAHLEFVRSIDNPIGLKVGPSMGPGELASIVRLLNPQGRPARLSLITRFGAHRVRQCLPPLLRAVRAEGIPVVWVCDPMHGNTYRTDSGLKSRRFGDILAEAQTFFAVHREEGTVPGGLHVELTGRDVTECTGGSASVLEEHLARRYETGCDPRLNREQSLELAFLVAEMLRAYREDCGRRSLAS